MKPAPGGGLRTAAPLLPALRVLGSSSWLADFTSLNLQMTWLQTHLSESQFVLEETNSGIFQDFS